MDDLAAAVDVAASASWTRCKGCGDAITDSRLAEFLGVCPACGHHHRISALAHIGLLIDFGTFIEHDHTLVAADPLRWDDGRAYPQVHQTMAEQTGVDESFVYGAAEVNYRKVLVGAFEFAFMGGTLGCVTGERLARMYERGLREKLPIIVFTQSGGARMQEGLYSLYQMPKVVSAVRRFQDAGGFCIHVLCDPTTGGVAASLSFLGDLVLAEPNALIGFSGPRVIREAIGEELPPGLQRSESLLANGLVDDVVPRADHRRVISDALRVAGR